MADPSPPPVLNEPTGALRALGQSLWLDNLSRPLLRSATLRRCIDDLGVTGLCASPVGFEQALISGAYDDSIRELRAAGLQAEALFHELALLDVGVAADLFRPAFDASDGLDGWVSLPLSPLLADNTAHTIHAANALHARAGCINLFIAVPGTPEGLRAVEELIVDSVPVHVTLLQSREHTQAAADAYRRGLERRLAAGRHLRVASVASMSVGAWDRAVRDQVQPPLRNRLGIAIAMQAWRAHTDGLAAPGWLQLAAAGARPQRIIWIDTGSHDPGAPDTLYVEPLATGGSIHALPQQTLLAFADHGRLQVQAMQPGDRDDDEALLIALRRRGVGPEALAERLQRDALDAQAHAWHAMLLRIGGLQGSGDAAGTGSHFSSAA